MGGGGWMHNKELAVKPMMSQHALCDWDRGIVKVRRHSLDRLHASMNKLNQKSAIETT